MKILYFTATGNSLYAARQIGGEQLSIPQLIKEGNYEVKDDAVGIVCPVYCGNIPKMVRRFLAKATIRTASEKDIDGQIRRIKIKGSGCRGGRLWMSRMAQLIATKRIEPEKLITHRYHGMENPV